jgi:hypothetical protein
MSSDSGDGRVVACRYNNAIISSTVLNYRTLVYDTHNAYSTGVFTAPVSGYYRGSMSLRPSLGLQIYGQINESTVETIYDGYNPGYSETIAFQYFLFAGQRLRFTSAGGSGFDSQLSNQAFTIERISAGSQIMAQTETVACSYRKTANETLSPGSSYTFQGLNFDTHGAWVTNTFTAPMSGIYQVTLIVGVSTTTGYHEFWVNGAFYCRVQLVTSGESVGTPTQLIRLNAGGTLQIRPQSNSQQISGSTPTDGNTSFINIHRIGI